MKKELKGGVLVFIGAFIISVILNLPTTKELAITAGILLISLGVTIGLKD